MECKYKPLLTQQQQQQQQQEQQQEQQQQQQYPFHPLKDEHQNVIKKIDSPLFVNTSFHDPVYGINSTNSRLKLGKFPVTINGHIISVKNKSYLCTKGLLSLLSQKIPSKEHYTEEDLINYKDMLLHTGAHLTKKGDRFKYCQGWKYMNIIKPLFLQQSALITTPYLQPELLTELQNRSAQLAEVEKSLQKSVSRTSKLMHSSTPSTSRSYHPRKISFTKSAGEGEEEDEGRKTGNGFMKVIKGVKSLRGFYWNDPNELVERLILLHASKAAGNTNVYNEILAIEEELREANIIY